MCREERDSGITARLLRTSEHPVDQVFGIMKGSTSSGRRFILGAYLHLGTMDTDMQGHTTSVVFGFGQRGQHNTDYGIVSRYFVPVAGADGCVWCRNVPSYGGSPPLSAHHAGNCKTSMMQAKNATTSSTAKDTKRTISRRPGPREGSLIHQRVTYCAWC